MLRWFVRKIVEYVLEELDARGRTAAPMAWRKSSEQAFEEEDDRLRTATRLALADSIVLGRAAEVQMSKIGETSKVEADREHGDRMVDRLASLNEGKKK